MWLFEIGLSFLFNQAYFKKLRTSLKMFEKSFLSFKQSGK